MKDTFSQATARLFRLRDPRIRIKGFAQEVRKIAAEYDAEIDAEEWKSLRPSFIPDAYLIDKDRFEVIMYEIEDTHMLKMEKMHKIVDLFLYLDSFFWRLKLIVTDRYGENQRELPIFDWSMSLDVKDA